MSFFADAFKEHAHLPLLITDTRSYTFQEVWQESLIAAKILQRHQGERVGLLMEQNEFSFFYLIGLWIIGATPALISPKAAPEEIKYFSQSANLKTILSPKKLSREKLSTPSFNSESAAILFTSGSTGLPKALSLTFDNLFYSALGSNKFYGIDESDKYLLTLPLNHVGGLMVFIRCLTSGSCLIFSSDLESSIIKHSPSLISLVPTQLIRLLRSSEVVTTLKKAKAILIGGDHLPEKYFSSELPLSITYGLSESTAQVAGSIPGTQKMKILPYREIIISSKGQIGIKGRTRFAHYLNQDDPFDNEDIYWAQDQGSLKNGFLKISGRLDDLFICGGENITPAEIEKALLKIDQIERAKVIPIKDEEYGQIPFAFYQSNTDLKDPSNILKKLLPAYKIPKFFLRLNSFDIKWKREKLIQLAQRHIDEVRH